MAATWRGKDEICSTPASPFGCSIVDRETTCEYGVKVLAWLGPPRALASLAAREGSIRLQARALRGRTVRAVT